VGGADLLLGLLRRERARRDDLRPRRRDLVTEALCLVALRHHEREHADGQDEDAGRADEHAHDGRRQLLPAHGHGVPPGARTPATTENSTDGLVPGVVPVARVLWLSVTFSRSGTSARRAMRRATPRCVNALPFITKLLGAGEVLDG